MGPGPGYWTFTLKTGETICVKVDRLGGVEGFVTDGWPEDESRQPDLKTVTEAKEIGEFVQKIGDLP